MTSHAWEASKRRTLAFAFAAIMAGCGGGGGSGGSETTTTEPTSPTNPTSPATPTDPPGPTTPTSPTSPTPPTDPTTPTTPTPPTPPTGPTSPTAPPPPAAPAPLTTPVTAAAPTPPPAPATSTTPPTTSASPQPGVLHTLITWAGAPDAGGWGYRDGPAGTARFEKPSAVAAASASDGSIWVAERSWPARVRHIDAQGRVSTALDIGFTGLSVDAGGSRMLLSIPGAMVAAPDGGAFVAMMQSRVDGGQVVGNGPWAVIRLAPGAAPRVVALPAAGHTHELEIRALALDAEGRLYIASACGIWRTDGEVLTATRPRSVSRVHDAAGPAGCTHQSLVSRLIVGAEGRLLFTLISGEVQRLEADQRVTTLGRTDNGTDSCGAMAADGRGGVLLSGGGTALTRLTAMGPEQHAAGSLTKAGWVDGSAEGARFRAVCGLAADGKGRVVLADRDNYTVRRIEPDGSVVTLAGRAWQSGHRDGIGTDALFGGLALGPGLGSEVVVAEGHPGTVRGVDGAQRVSTLAGAPREPEDPWVQTDGPLATARLYLPNGALRTADGSLWIADHQRLRRLGPDGILRTLATSTDRYAYTLALDRAGDVVVVWGDFRMSTPPSHLDPVFVHFERYFARNPTAAPTRLEVTMPAGLETSYAGNVVPSVCALPDGSLAFTRGHAVWRRTADGRANPLAGSPVDAGTADGPAADARFDRPIGLACDDAGGIYVADALNHTVRYIDAQRSVRTVLGVAGQRGHAVGKLPGLLESPGSLVLVPGGLVVATGLGLVRAGF
jgi:hypothetical protein